MYESGRPEGKEVLQSLTICIKLYLKCATMFLKKFSIFRHSSDYIQIQLHPLYLFDYIQTFSPTEIFLVSKRANKTNVLLHHFINLI